MTSRAHALPSESHRELTRRYRDNHSSSQTRVTELARAAVKRSASPSSTEGSRVYRARHSSLKERLNGMSVSQLKTYFERRPATFPYNEFYAEIGNLNNLVLNAFFTYSPDEKILGSLSHFKLLSLPLQRYIFLNHTSRSIALWVASPSFTPELMEAFADSVKPTPIVEVNRKRAFLYFAAMHSLDKPRLKILLENSPLSLRGALLTSKVLKDSEKAVIAENFHLFTECCSKNQMRLLAKLDSEGKEALCSTIINTIYTTANLLDLVNSVSGKSEVQLLGKYSPEEFLRAAFPGVFTNIEEPIVFFQALHALPPQSRALLFANLTIATAFGTHLPFIESVGEPMEYPETIISFQSFFPSFSPLTMFAILPNILDSQLEYILTNGDLSAIRAVLDTFSASTFRIKRNLHHVTAEQAKCIVKVLTPAEYAEYCNCFPIKLSAFILQSATKEQKEAAILPLTELYATGSNTFSTAIGLSSPVSTIIFSNTGDNIQHVNTMFREQSNFYYKKLWFSLLGERQVLKLATGSTPILEVNPATTALFVYRYRFLRTSQQQMEKRKLVQQILDNTSNLVFDILPVLSNLAREANRLVRRFQESAVPMSEEKKAAFLAERKRITSEMMKLSRNNTFSYIHQLKLLCHLCDEGVLSAKVTDTKHHRVSLRSLKDTLQTANGFLDSISTMKRNAELKALEDTEREAQEAALRMHEIIEETAHTRDVWTTLQQTLNALGLSPSSFDSLRLLDLDELAESGIVSVGQWAELGIHDEATFLANADTVLHQRVQEHLPSARA